MCTRVATGEWQDKRLPSLEGLKVEREVALMGDRPLVRLRVRFANETEEGKFLHYWFQNIGSAGGSVPRDRIFRPGTEALDPEIGDVTQ